MNEIKLNENRYKEQEEIIDKELERLDIKIANIIGETATFCIIDMVNKGLINIEMDEKDKIGKVSKDIDEIRERIWRKTRKKIRKLVEED